MEVGKVPYLNLYLRCGSAEGGRIAADIYLGTC